MRFRVEVVDLPTTFADYGKITLLHQSRIRPVEHISSPNACWEIEVNEREGKWTGTNVGRNSDGRRFIYFAWQSEAGQMFRRIKLYQDQVEGPVVRIQGKFPDGSPACSTARLADS